jgi:hypothetical protein
MSDRVLNRAGARELTPEEVEKIDGAQTTGLCVTTTIHEGSGPPITDQKCDVDGPA